MPSPWRKRLLGEWSWLRLCRSTLLIGAVIYLFLIAAGLFLSNSMIFPYRGSSYDESLPGLKLLTAPDGTQIATRYWRAPDASALVLLFHGNYEDIGQLDEVAEALGRRGFAVLMVDYRGYGLSGGTPNEKRCYADARLAVEQAGELGFAPGDIVLWGRSVGSGVAVQLAVELEARALVLESPFASAFRALTRIRLLPFDRFDNLAKIGRVDEPLFVLHGAADDIIPAWHSAKLFERHAGPKDRHVVPDTGHNDLWLGRIDPVLDKMAAFVEANAH